ncbi:MAG: HD domain-containing protein [Lachnospiraceae bacterium]|jgi:uncharacterized protein|nr:HD domain-containing protein [Lachnospiraceae bacterium]
MKSTSEIAKRMIDYSDGSLHDIAHFLKVWAFARTIGEGEHLCEKDQFILETAAIVHDIACPLCRTKYGNTDGKYQEKEGTILAGKFLNGQGLQGDELDRVVFLVGHHHTYTDVNGPDYQILLEADYLVNADESGYSRDNIRNTMRTVFRTKTGLSLLKSIYLRE